MLSIFLEHHSQKAARRALLISAFITLLIPTMKISGEGLDLLGLKLYISLENILISFRILTAYFLWVFSWFTLHHYYNLIESLTIVFLEKRTQERRSRANLEEADFQGANLQDPNEDEMPWFVEVKRIQRQGNRYKGFLKVGSSLINSLMALSIEFLPPIVLGVAAVAAPEIVSGYFFV